MRLRLLGGTLALALPLLGGCSVFDRVTGAGYQATGRLGERIGMPWGGPDADIAEDSLTIRRLRGDAEQVATLAPEPGNVWPAQEARRATLANPDAALRGIPEYRPDDRALGRPPVSAPTDPTQVPPGSTSRGAPARRGSSSPPPPPIEGRLGEPTAAAPPAPTFATEPRRDGRTLLPPGGPPAVQSGGTGRVGSATGADGRPGIVTQDGGITTLTDPTTGQVRSFPTPR